MRRDVIDPSRAHQTKVGNHFQTYGSVVRVDERCEPLKGKKYECVDYTCPGPAWEYCTAQDVDVIILGGGYTALGAARFIERYNALQNRARDKVTYRILEGGRGAGYGRGIASNFIHGAEG